MNGSSSDGSNAPDGRRPRDGGPERLPFVRRHTDLAVNRKAFAAAMTIFRHSRTFPREERYSLTDQIRRSSRSVCSNISEGWRKRRYPAVFVNKLTDAEGEAAETQTWLQFAVKCGYLPEDAGRDLFEAEEEVLRMLTSMRNNPDRWRT